MWQVEANIQGNPLNLGACSPHKLYGVKLQKKVIFTFTNEIKENPQNCALLWY
jgi:hypothetical protein